MPDKEKEKEEEKKSTLQEKLDAIDEIKDLAIKNITARIKTDEPNNNYTKPPTKMRKLVGLKKFKGFKGSETQKTKEA